MEDKLQALICLCHRAKTKREKKYRRRIVTYYQAALRQLGMEGKKRFPGEKETGEIVSSEKIQKGYAAGNLKRYPALFFRNPEERRVDVARAAMCQ